MNKYKIGQLFKNSPSDNYPYFKLIQISVLNDTVYYKVVSLHDEDLTIILHDEDMYLFE